MCPWVHICHLLFSGDRRIEFGRGERGVWERWIFKNNKRRREIKKVEEGDEGEGINWGNVGASNEVCDIQTVARTQEFFFFSFGDLSESEKAFPKWFR